MSDKCNEFKEKLIDIFYEEKALNKEEEGHMESCQECRQYWEELQLVKVELERIEPEVPIDYMKVTQAFEKAEEILEERRNIKSLLAFILTASLLLTFVAILAMKGYVREIIYFQIGTYIIIPLLLPIIIKIRSRKESYNEQH